MAEEAGLSRLYGGIHFRADIAVGARMGPDRRSRGGADAAGRAGRVTSPRPRDALGDGPGLRPGADPSRGPITGLDGADGPNSARRAAPRRPGRAAQLDVAGRLQAGDRLREVHLASTLGTSRGPVREAMRQLEQEGLVSMRPHRGATVVGVPADEVETIYELRAGLEARAMRHASARATDEDLDALDAMVVAMIAASRAGDPETVTELDIRFHARVIELAGFQYLRRLWSSVESLVRAGSAAIQGRRDVRGPDGRVRFLVEPSLEHEAIVGALRARDPELAAAEARAHVLRALERLARERTTPQAGG